MKILEHAHKALFFGGLSMVTLSFLLDFYFATDTSVPLPEPNALSLLALGGVVAIAVALVRRRKK